MRRDFVFALAVSLLLHGGLAGFSQLLKKPGGHVIHCPEPAVVTMVMPPLDPDPLPPTEKSDEPAPAADFAPPMIRDVPQLVRDDSFVQPMQPPLPDSIRVDTGAVVIPPGRPGGSSPPVAFDPKALDQLPTATYQAKPAYPFELRQRGVTGEVVVGFIVDASGAVQNAYALRSTDGAFEASAVQAVMHWKFKPGRKGGRAVNTRLQVPIVFSINEGAD